MTEHHLIPKCKGGAKKERVMLHRVCHDKIHATFTEKELARKYNTIPDMMKHPDIKKFVEWIASKPVDFYVSSRKYV